MKKNQNLSNSSSQRSAQSMEFRNSRIRTITVKVMEYEKFKALIDAIQSKRLLCRTDDMKTFHLMGLDSDGAEFKKAYLRAGVGPGMAGKGTFKLFARPDLALLFHLNEDQFIEVTTNCVDNALPMTDIDSLFDL